MPTLCKHCGRELPFGVQFCPVCGGVGSQPAPGSLGDAGTVSPFPQPEKKLITVLSADFQGFTTYTASRDAEEVRDFINFCWKQVAPLIEGHGGRVEKYIGDAVVALFGAGRAREEDPIQAVKAALAIQNCLRQIEADGNQPLLPMRIGIHTGRVVIETDATGVKAFGDTAPVADRLQKLAPAGGVLISHDTYRHLKGLFDVQPPRLESLAGRENPMLTYVVLRAKPRSRRGQESSAAMVDRVAELELLLATLHTAIEKQEPRQVTILGEPGLGKSRLVGEFLKRGEPAFNSVRLFFGRATAEMSGSPFALLRDLLAARFDILDGDSTAVAKEKLQAGVEDLLAEQASPRVHTQPESVAHFLGHLAGLDFSTSPHLKGLAGDPERFRVRAFQAALQFFTAAGSQPSGTPPKNATDATLLVAEDIHWSDDGFLELLAHLAKASRGAPLLIICVSRPELLERRPAWGKDFLAHTLIRLPPLPTQESSFLVKTILSQAREIPSELLERVVGDAEGNPFYIEEIIKMLIEQGVIQPGLERWKVELTRLASATVPSTLTGVLQARLDALEPQERAVAQQASVLGRVFCDAALPYLGASDDSGRLDVLPAGPAMNQSQLEEALAGLCRKQILCRRETSSQSGTVEYSFSHDLLRNVAYEELLKKPQRRLHERAASWLIRQGGERVNESAGVVAGHFEKAGRITEAADWHGRAGQQASGSHLPAAAVESFRKALELSHDQTNVVGELLTKRLKWFDGLAESLSALARFPEAREAYLCMRELAENGQDMVDEARACNGLAFLHERQGNNYASIEAADQAIELCQRAGPAARAEEFRALYFKGWAYYRLADAKQILGLAERCRTLCSELGDQAGMARTFKLYGVAHLQLGHYAEADQYFRQGLEISQQTGDLVTVSAMWNNRAETARARGDYEAAASMYQTALDITRQIGWRDSERIYLCNLSAARIGLHQFAQAEADLREVVAQAAPAGAWNLPEALILLSEACLEQSKLDEALESGLRALDLARSSGNSLFTADAWRAVGRAMAAVSPLGSDWVRDHQLTNLPAGPDQCFQESLSVYQKIGARGEEARTLRIWAEFDLQCHHDRACREKLEKSLQMFQTLDMASEINKANALLASLGS
jgi:predicted ATPase/class 3 adenylate cyclase